jgi:hypothetical protein
MGRLTQWGGGVAGGSRCVKEGAGRATGLAVRFEIIPFRWESGSDVSGWLKAHLNVITRSDAMGA